MGQAVPNRADKSAVLRWAVARRRGVELLVVFFGVYAAFLLNRVDTYRRDEQRRRQLLAALEQEITANLHAFEVQIAGSEPQLSAFHRQLDAGEMPHLAIILSDSSYDASDDATLMQSGGLELLDVQSVELLRQVDNRQRALVAANHNQFEFCLAELVNHSPEDFYDQSTRRLKPRYTWYPQLLDNLLSQSKGVVVTEKALLAHLREEEHPGTTPWSETPAAAPAASATPPATPKS